MRQRLSSLPTWALLLLIWVPSTAFVFVISLFSQADLRWIAGFAAILGLLLAVALTSSLRIRWRMEDDALGQVSADFRKSVTRAAWSGPVPADPETRAAALRLAERHLQHAHRIRRWMYVAMACLAISVIGNAILDPWNLLFSVVHLPLLVFVFIVPKRLRSRVSLLSATE